MKNANISKKPTTRYLDPRTKNRIEELIKDALKKQNQEEDEEEEEEEDEEEEEEENKGEEEENKGEEEENKGEDLFPGCEQDPIRMDEDSDSPARTTKTEEEVNELFADSSDDDENSFQCVVCKKQLENEQCFPETSRGEPTSTFWCKKHWANEARARRRAENARKKSQEANKKRLQEEAEKAKQAKTPASDKKADTKVKYVMLINI